MHRGVSEQGRKVLPQRIGRYEVLGELGAGGMAVVYLARAAGLGGFERLVAVKRLHEHLGRDQDFVRMFLDEARVAARVHHPNVVAVYEVDEVDDRYFLVMDYIRGEPLSFVLNQAWRGPAPGGFPPRLAASIFVELADALHVAHELRDLEGRPLGVIHRDISTRNLMFGYDGLIRLLDFGVAKAHDQSQRTRTGAQKGTVAYMAPEQILARALDRRVDIFSLGIVLWESTLGRRLFQAENDFATAARIRQASVPKPSSLAPDYPKKLEEIILKALQRDPEDRFSTAHELAQELRDFVADGPALMASDARTYLRDLLPGRLDRRLETERSALFENSRRVPITYSRSEFALDLEVSAGLPAATRAEVNRSAPEGPDAEAEAATTHHSAKRAEAEPEVDGPRTYHGGEDSQTFTQETLSQHEAKVDERTERDGYPQLNLQASEEVDLTTPPPGLETLDKTPRSGVAHLLSGLVLGLTPPGRRPSSGGKILNPPTLPEGPRAKSGQPRERTPGLSQPSASPGEDSNPTPPLNRSGSAVVFRARTSDPAPEESGVIPRELFVPVDTRPMREAQLAPAVSIAWGGDTSTNARPSSGRTVWWVAGIALVLASIALGATLQIAVLSEPTDASQPAPKDETVRGAAPLAERPELAVEPPIPAPQAVETTTHPPPAPAVETPVPKAAEAPKVPLEGRPTREVVEIRFRGLPSGASVTGEQVDAEGVLRLPKGSQPQRVLVRARGYKPLEVEVGEAQAPYVELRMIKDRRRR